MNKSLIVNNIMEVIRKHVDCVCDVRIYFDGRAYDLKSSGGYTVVEDINPSDYFEYADNASVSVSYEGEMYDLIYNQVDGGDMYEDMLSMLTQHGYFFEFGDGWNFTLYENN